MDKQEKQRRIISSYYKRCDGKSVYVIGVFKNVSTNTREVLCRRESDKGYFIMNYDDFCADVIYNGKTVHKFKLDTSCGKLDIFDVNELIRQGYPPPIRHTKEYYLDDPFDLFRPICHTYYDYAKDICDGYGELLRLYKLIKEGTHELTYNEPDDAKRIIEDVEFIQNAIHTLLSQYESFFTAHCQNKQSIRSYAKEHNLNRGSVEHLKKKMLASVANLLEKRDKDENVCRLAPMPHEVPTD